MTLLAVDGLEARHGQLLAVRGVSMTLLAVDGLEARHDDRPTGKAAR